jgi:glucose-6-phosphate isomerase
MNGQITVKACNEIYSSEKVSVDYRDRAESALLDVVNRSGKGNEWLGWMDIPSGFDSDNFAELERVAKRLRLLDAVVVVGIGGSYLGTRALVTLLSDGVDRDTPEIMYAGYHLSGRAFDKLKRKLEGKDFGVIVISKSGTTIEPAISYRLLNSLMAERFNDSEIALRTVYITDPEDGALRKMSTEKGIDCFDIPKSVGGRYSVLTPVGMLPALIAGIDIKEIIRGAADVYNSVKNRGEAFNNITEYVAARNAMYDEGKKIEIFGSFDADFSYMLKWWQQLFGESEGKEGKGLFPVSADFTTDLHSIGQFIQQGDKSFFETMLVVDNPENCVTIPPDESDYDKLNYLAGNDIEFVNRQALEGTCKAHVDGGVSLIRIEINGVKEYSIGQFVMFMQFACAASGYMLGVNPFDQPGVEDYKRNMKHLLNC